MSPANADSQRYACAVLSTLSSSKAISAAILKDSALVDQLKSLLASPGTPADTKEFAALVVANVFSSSTANGRRSLADDGLLASLVSLANTAKTEKAKLASAYGLYHYTRDSGNRCTAAAAADAIEALNKIVCSAKSADAQCTAAGALQHIFSHVPQSTLAQVQATRSIKALLHVFHNSSDGEVGVVQRAAGALFQLTSWQDCNNAADRKAAKRYCRAAAACPGLVAALVRCMRDEASTPKARMAAATSYRLMLMLEPRPNGLVQAAADAGGVDAAVSLLALMQQQPEECVHLACVLSILGNLTSVRPQAMSRRAADAGAIELLLQHMLLQPDATSRSQLGATMGAIVARSGVPKHAQAAVRAGAVRLLLPCLEANDPLVLEGGVTALHNITIALPGGGSSRRNGSGSSSSAEVVEALAPLPAAAVALLLVRRALLPAGSQLECLVMLNVLAGLDQSLAAAAVAAGGRQLPELLLRTPGATADMRQAALGLHRALQAVAPAALAAAAAAVGPPAVAALLAPPSAAAPVAAITDGSRSLASCAACGASHRADGGSLSICSGCSKSAYCSSACQSAHWEQHKLLCSQRAGCSERVVNI